MDAVAPVTDLQSALGAETVSSGHFCLCLLGCTLGSEDGGPGVDPVAELAKRGRQGELFVRGEDPVEEPGELRAVDVKRLAWPSLAGVGQRGKRSPTILWTGFAAHEAGFGQAVDRSGETARGQIRLGGEVAHPQSPAWRSGQSDQDLEVLASKFALTLQGRADRSMQP